MKRFLIASVAAVTLGLGISQVHAANLTPDQMVAATTANNSDLLLIYPAGGPLKAVQWSVLKGLMQTQLGSAYLQVANGLSDLPSVTVARANLGLGTAATLSTGTSGATLPLLNGVNTWSGAQTFSGGLSGALTGPVTGNVTGNLTGNVTGSLSGNAATASALASAQTISMSGDVSYTSGAFNGSAGVSGTALLATVNSNVGSFGSATAVPIFTVNGKGLITTAGSVTVVAPTLQTARTISITGDLTYTSPGFDGSANVSANGTLNTVNSNVGSFGSSTSIPQVTVNAKGLVTAIGTNSIPSASTSTAGLAPFATGAQAVAGTDTAHAVTPASLTSQMSLGSTGYYTLPGGLIYEWGSTSSFTGSISVSLPLACTTALFNVQITPLNTTIGTPTAGDAVSSFSTTGFTLQNGNGVNKAYNWLAICK